MAVEQVPWPQIMFVCHTTCSMAIEYVPWLQCKSIQKIGAQDSETLGFEKLYFLYKSIKGVRVPFNPDPRIFHTTTQGGCRPPGPPTWGEGPRTLTFASRPQDHLARGTSASGLIIVACGHRTIVFSKKKYSLRKEEYSLREEEYSLREQEYSCREQEHSLRG